MASDEKTNDKKITTNLYGNKGIFTNDLFSTHARINENKQNTKQNRTRGKRKWQNKFFLYTYKSKHIDVIFNDNDDLSNYTLN